MKEKWKKWFRKDNLLILILSGVLLFIITIPVGEEKEQINTTESGAVGQVPESETQVTVSTDYISDLEKQLEGILSAMSGVGKAEVMITLKESEELIVEKDSPYTRSNTNESDSAGGSRIITDMDSAESTVYATNGSNAEPYVIKTISPQVEGVVVVAQGAGSGAINQNITEMIQALFGVEAHKVKVVKMASDR